MKNFSDYINENKITYAWFSDSMGNDYRVSSKATMTNKNGLGLSLTKMKWMLNDNEVRDEEGNVGNKDYNNFITDRINFIDKPKDNADFAKKLNKIFKVKYFTSKALF